MRTQVTASMGLLTMGERIAQFGGQLVMESKPTIGTQIIVKVPLQQESPSTVHETPMPIPA
ncbi:MAG: hypothetical protein R2867_39720 [Caldilineaceae bacterium]